MPSSKARRIKISRFQQQFATIQMDNTFHAFIWRKIERILNQPKSYVKKTT